MSTGGRVRVGVTLALAAVAGSVAAPGLASAALPVAETVFVLPSASMEAWAPNIIPRIDPWSSTGALTRRIDSNYFTCAPGCSTTIVDYPRTAGVIYGPHAPSADESVRIGTDAVLAGLQTAGQPVVVAGLSLGSLVSDSVQANSLGLAPDQLSFIVAGDPSRVTPMTAGVGSYFSPGWTIPLMGWTVTRPTAESPYNTTVVVGEYDAAADFPNRPWNLVADLNAILGFGYGHGNSSLTSPADVPAQNITVVTNSLGATTTTYLYPHAELPLLTPLKGLLPSRTLAALNTALTPVVQRAYARYDSVTGNHAPYLQATAGAPKLVVPRAAAAARPASAKGVSSADGRVHRLGSS